jgi:hypothetical protein
MMSASSVATPVRPKAKRGDLTGGAPTDEAFNSLVCPRFERQARA